MYVYNKSYLQSLQECVQRLQDSSIKLQSSVHKLELSTRNFTRIRKLIACQRVYELVTEPEIRDAQSSLAVQLEPRIRNLLLKAEHMLKELEEQENILQEEADRREYELDSELKKAQLDSLQCSISQNEKGKYSMNQSGQTRQQNQVEHTKKLKEVKRKVERMAEIVTQLEEEYNQKEAELKLQKQRVATEKRPSAIKISKRNPRRKSSSSIALAAIEEQIRNIDILIGEKREILDEQQSTSLDAETPPDEDLKWKQYQAQSEFFKRALQQIESKFNWKNDAVMDFEISCNSYTESLDNVHFGVQKAVSSQQEDKYKGIETMKILSKLFYPTDNMGITIATLVENLLQTEKKEKDIKELEKEFPPEQERLHRLKTAIILLNQLEITETVLKENSAWIRISNRITADL